MKYFFKAKELVYIKVISETECEYVKLELEGNMFVPKLDTIRSDYEENLEIFLHGAIPISEDHYYAIARRTVYNRLPKVKRT